MPDGVSLGTAYAEVVLDASTFASSMQQLQSSFQSGLQSMTSRMEDWGKSMMGVGASLVGLTAPLVIVGKQGLDAAADFDVLLKQIQVFGGVAPDELDKVRAFALKMGQDTKFSSSEAADALLGLLKSGQSLQQAMSTLPSVLNLAAAGGLGLANASEIVAAALAQFKLKAEDAGRVSNALAQAANASAADVSDLGQGLANVGPIASQFGLSVEDTAAVLGVFANNGIKGAEAGTQLKSMLLNMANPSDTVREAFEKLNVSLYDSQGNTRNFNTVIKELDAALKKLPVNEQNELMQQLAGSYGITGLNALRAAGGIDSMLAAMGNAPSAGQVANEFMNTFSGKVESLTGSIETLLIEAMTPFMNDVLTPIVGLITNVVNAMTDWASAHPGLTKAIAGLVSLVAGAGAGLMSLGGVFLAISKVLPLLSYGFSAIGGVLGMLFSPIGLLIGAVVGLVAAFQTNFLGIRDLLQPIIDNIVRGVESLIGVIGNFGNILKNDGIGEAIASIINTFMEMLGLVAFDEMSPAAEQMGNGIVTAFLTVVQFIQTQVLPALQQFANWFLNDALPAVVGFVTGTVIPAIQQFFTFLGNAWTIAAPALQQLANWFLLEALPAVQNFISNVVIPGIQNLINTLVRVWTDVSPFLLSLFDWFMNTGLPLVKDFISNVVIPGIQNLINTLVRVWTDVSPFLLSLFDWFMNTGLPLVKDFISNVVIPAVQLFVDTLAKIWEQIQPGLQTMYDWFITTGLPVIKDFIAGPFTTAISDVIKTVGDVISKVSDWIQKNPELFQTIVTVTGAMMAAGVVIVGLKTAYDGVSTALTVIKGGFGLFNSGLLTTLGPIAAVMAALVALIEMYNRIKQFQADISQIAQNAGKSAADIIKENNITREQAQAQAFKSTQAQFGGGFIGDLGARLLYGSGIVNMEGKVNEFYDAATGNKKAAGGPVSANTPYLVGEKGPELYVPNQSGSIVPNDALSQALMQSFSANRAPAYANAGWGGGNTTSNVTNNQFSIQMSVPLEILKDEPNLQRNADAFGERLRELLQSRGN